MLGVYFPISWNRKKYITHNFNRIIHIYIYRRFNEYGNYTNSNMYFEEILNLIEVVVAKKICETYEKKS